ncbi:carbohydrate ABC transporter permease [Angustibacter speluncae]
MTAVDAGRGAPARRTTSVSRLRLIQQGGGVVLLAVVGLIWVAPFLWGIVTSFKSEADAAALPVRVVPEGGWTLAAYRSVLEQGDLVRWLANSLFTATVITAVTLVISAMAAYALSRGLFRGRRLLMAATLASIMVPGQILIVPLFQEMLLLNMIDTYWAIILPQVVAPVMVFVLKRFFDAIPIELEDAARVDGASRWRTFVSVVLPLSRSVLSAVAIFVFIGAWNNFLWPFIAVNDPGLMTMPVGLATVENAYGVQYAQDNAAAVLAALPLLVVFILFQRHIVRGFATTGLGGQ